MTNPLFFPSNKKKKKKWKIGWPGETQKSIWNVFVNKKIEKKLNSAVAKLEHKKACSFFIYIHKDYNLYIYYVMSYFRVVQNFGFEISWFVYKCLRDIRGYKTCTQKQTTHVVINPILSSLRSKSKISVTNQLLQMKKINYY
jgi:Asp-tRNA(Asn)/Glu-tRNA(Gln) amidotransferase A subunit family amidase